MFTASSETAKPSTRGTRGAEGPVPWARARPPIRLSGATPPRSRRGWGRQCTPPGACDSPILVRLGSTSRATLTSHPPRLGQGSGRLDPLEGSRGAFGSGGKGQVTSYQTVVQSAAPALPGNAVLAPLGGGGGGGHGAQGGLGTPALRGVSREGQRAASAKAAAAAAGKSVADIVRARHILNT